MATKRFPMKLKQLRARRGWTQERLAKEMGVTREYIARLETGHHDPPLSTLERLAKALGAKIGKLLE